MALPTNCTSNPNGPPATPTTNPGVAISVDQNSHTVRPRGPRQAQGLYASRGDRLHRRGQILLRALMGSHMDRPQVTVLEIVDTGRRRRWSKAEKLRIVEESFFPTSAGVGDGSRARALAPPTMAAPAARGRDPRAERIEIVLTNGRWIVVDLDIDPVALSRLVFGAGAGMIALPPGVRVWLAGGATDMRKGMNGLALEVRQV